MCQYTDCRVLSRLTEKMDKAEWKYSGYLNCNLCLTVEGKIDVKPITVLFICPACNQYYSAKIPRVGSTAYNLSTLSIIDVLVIRGKGVVMIPF